MKLPYTLFIIAILIIGLASCKKGNNEPITGKWQQTKLRLYEFNNSNVVLYDTTYLAPFTNLDYVQFNSSGTCDLSSDHYYYPNDKEGYPTTPQAIPQSVGTLKYTRTDNKYVLSSASNLINPGGFDIRDTVSVSGNTLLLRSTNYGHGGGHIFSIADSYYTR